MKELKEYIRSIPDFPEKGIIFRDVTSVLQDADALKLSIDELAKRLEGVDFDVIAGAESRGFIFGAPLAYVMHKPFVPIRKKGKLPCETVEKTYDLEYGTATIEMHKDAVKKGEKVVLLDDLIATGGTMKAAAELVEELGGEVVKLSYSSRENKTWFETGIKEWIKALRAMGHTMVCFMVVGGFLIFDCK